MGVVTATATLLIGAPSASASYGKLAQYQITFSQNCNNPAVCLGHNDGLGGDGGWVALNNDGTGGPGDHLLRASAGGGRQCRARGRGHFAWHIDTANGVFFIDSASDPEFQGDTPIPAAPGHYNLHPAHGVAIEITVAKIPNR